MNILRNISLVLLVLVSFASCKKDSRPNYEYMPNMYESVGYEAYQEADVFKGDVEAQLPAEGSIPRGYTPFDIENNTGGYELAKLSLTNPLDSNFGNDAVIFESSGNFLILFRIPDGISIFVISVIR